jgi:hypothetical protein
MTIDNPRVRKWSNCPLRPRPAFIGIIACWLGLVSCWPCNPLHVLKYGDEVAKQKAAKSDLGDDNTVNSNRNIEA